MVKMIQTLKEIIKGVVLTTMIALIPGLGHADIVLGGFTFDDDAFPDAAFYVSGGPPSLSFASTGDANLDLLMAADSDATTYIFGTPVVFDLAFVDNRMINDPGADLVVFELGANDGAVVDIEVEGSLVGGLPYLMTPTGDTAAGFSLNAAAIDLDDFGIAPGTRVQIIRINNDSSLVPGGQTISSAIAAVGALNSVPPALQVDVDIKFCSDPNAFNCKKNGVLPVTIFGTADFLVEDIDPSTLQLCSADLSFCTEAPRDWSYAYRGDPLLDLGAPMCAIDPDTGMELDWTENQDDYLELDAAFEVSEVKVILGDFCDDAAKGDVSEALVIIGETYDGVPIYSVPADDNTGIDRLVKVNK
jgi:hypothetical protein